MGRATRAAPASVELRAKRVRIARPDNGLVEDFPKTIELSLVEAREVNAPAGKTPLLWRLMTTHSVADAAQADEIVQLYRLRWRIEQTFRALKSDGLALEDSQIIEPERMFNLAAMALIAAIRYCKSMALARASASKVDWAMTPRVYSSLRMRCRMDRASTGYWAIWR